MLLTTGSLLSHGKKMSIKKKFRSYNLASCPIWSKKYKKSISNEIKNYNEVVVLEDHYFSCGFSSFLLEIIHEFSIRTKLISYSADKKNMYLAADQITFNSNIKKLPLN